jgi:ribosomal-protein-alanine N-acetyltransferase
MKRKGKNRMSKMGILIETERLIIREIKESDDKGMFELDSDREVHKFLGNKPFKTIEQSRDLIKYIQQQYIENGIGRWVVVEKTTKQFIGWTGLKLVKETIHHRTDYYDVGFRLKRKFWGKGYATESAKAALDYGIVNLPAKELYAMADVDNFASRRVLEKIGMNYIETFEYDGDPTWRAKGEPTAWYKK